MSYKIDISQLEVKHLERIRALVKALRCGVYLQGRELLRSRIKEIDLKYCFCPLGVACEISGLGGWKQDYFVDNPKKIIGYDYVTPAKTDINESGIDISNGLLPKAVYQYYGLDKVVVTPDDDFISKRRLNNIYVYKDLEKSKYNIFTLTFLNDREDFKLSHSEAAKLIENTYLV